MQVVELCTDLATAFERANHSVGGRGRTQIRPLSFCGVTLDRAVKETAENGMTKFVKGNPGGPGRPRTTEEEKQKREEDRDIRRMALKHVDQALQALVTHLASDSSSAAVSAAKELLDRAFGKSTQHTTSDVTVTTNGREQLQRKLAGLDREPEAPGDSQSTH